jgi:hypothetical protein
MYFYKSSPKKCPLCQSTEKLSQEHKFKYSALRKIHNKEPITLMKKNQEVKLQSSNDKNVMFKNKICQNCNNNLTQPADKAFDKINFEFLTSKKESYSEEDLKSFMCKEDLINIFRYFSKIICCQLSDLELPIPVSLAKFSINKSFDIILMKDLNLSIGKIKEKESYKKITSGEFLLSKDILNNKITGIYHYLIFNDVLYSINFRFNEEEINEIELNYKINFDKYDNII